MLLTFKGASPRVRVIVSKSCEQRPRRLHDWPVPKWRAHPPHRFSFSMDARTEQELGGSIAQSHILVGPPSPLGHGGRLLHLHPLPCSSWHEKPQS